LTCFFSTAPLRLIRFLDKMDNTFYPALCAQAASGGEKCLDYVFSGDAADRETAVSKNGV